MTAPLAAEGAAAATGGEVAAVAPSSSAPVGTAGRSAGTAGTRARTQRDLRPRKGRTKRTNTAKSAPAGDSGGGGKPDNGGQLGKWGRRAAGPSKGRMGRSGARQTLVAEFVVCVLILALSPLTDRHRDDTPPAWMKRGTSICGLFVVLGLVATGGPRAARIAASFGGLVTLVLAVSDRDVFATIARRLGTASSGGPAGPEGTGALTGDIVPPASPGGAEIRVRGG